MKDVIVLTAVLPITLAFIVLIGYINISADHEDVVREVVYASVQEAGQDGYFTSGNLNNMKKEIADVMGLEASDVKISTDVSVKYRPEVINYKVTVPIKKVVPANKLFGISDNDNTGKIIIEGNTMSERLTP